MSRFLPSSRLIFVVFLLVGGGIGIVEWGLPVLLQNRLEEGGRRLGITGFRYRLESIGWNRIVLTDLAAEGGVVIRRATLTYRLRDLFQERIQTLTLTEGIFPSDILLRFFPKSRGRIPLDDLTIQKSRLEMPTTQISFTLKATREESATGERFRILLSTRPFAGRWESTSLRMGEGGIEGWVAWEGNGSSVQSEGRFQFETLSGESPPLRLLSHTLLGTFAFQYEGGECSCRVHVQSREGSAEVKGVFRPLSVDILSSATARPFCMDFFPFTGTVHLAAGPFRWNEPQDLGSFLPSLSGIEVMGSLTAEAECKIHPTGIQPQIWVTVQEGTVASAIWDAHVGGLEGVIEYGERGEATSRLTIGWANVGRIRLDGGEIVFRIFDPSTIRLEKSLWRWQQASLSTSSFLLTPSTGKAEFVVRIDHLPLREFLAFFPGRVMSGEGELAGEIPVIVRWDSGRTTLSLGRGYLAALPPGGTLHIYHADLLREPLRNALRGRPWAENLAERILDVLADCVFTELRIESLGEPPEAADARITLRGKGKGEQPIELGSLTVNIHNLFAILVSQGIMRSREGLYRNIDRRLEEILSN